MKTRKNKTNLRWFAKKSYKKQSLLWHYNNLKEFLSPLIQVLNKQNQSSLRSQVISQIRNLYRMKPGNSLFKFGTMNFMILARLKVLKRLQRKSRKLVLFQCLLVSSHQLIETKSSLKSLSHQEKQSLDLLHLEWLKWCWRKARRMLVW